MIHPRRRRTSAAVLVSIGFSLGACASAGTGVPRPVSLEIEVKNDLAPPADVEVFLYPVGGDTHDRVELGVVAGGATLETAVTVPDRGMYFLRAARVVPVPDAPFPVNRPRAVSSWDTRRFALRRDSCTLTWMIRTNSLALPAEGC